MSTATFEPRLDILPPAQRRLWDELIATPQHFVLYGGTAIALRLGHRQSEDFDFFSAEPFSPRLLKSGIGYLDGAEIIQSEKNTLTCIADRGGPVQVSFFGGLDLNRVTDPGTPAGPVGIRVAALVDLMAVKLGVVMERAAYKDYFDIAALLRAGVGLAEGLGAAQAIFGPSFNPLISIKALMFYDDGDLSRLEPETRSKLTEAARTTDPRTLPVIASRKGLF
ncbi:MAG: nucleotidyl transferase AbiEii/AbiGii toxin family protein [Candidatus Acidiferrales bacterium]